LSHLGISGTGISHHTTNTRICGYAAASTANANNFAPFEMIVANYDDANQKYAMFRSATITSTTSGNIYTLTSKWVTTSAVTSITLTPGLGTNFVSGSTLTLYGQIGL
jgi:hypothetical protein